MTIYINGVAQPAGATDPHGVAQHTDVTRYFFSLALDDTDPDVTAEPFNYGLALTLADGQGATVHFEFRVPDDFVSYTSLKAVWMAAPAVGNMRWSLNAEWKADNEPYNQHTEIGVIGQTATQGVNVINVQDPSTPLVLAGLALGDFLGVRFTRDGAHALDTIDADVRLKGILFEYVASQ